MTEHTALRLPSVADATTSTYNVELTGPQLQVLRDVLARAAADPEQMGLGVRDWATFGRARAAVDAAYDDASCVDEIVGCSIERHRERHRDSVRGRIADCRFADHGWR